ncbi:hypothetical protein [Hyalangium gracile]|uniref:hypothetical protein n=1 Tax=Hyalangium gracile TaxID=394092 RepID=UPI001CCE83EC|nr:hypothetical protein [Hyalangium gracile]
MSQDPKELAQQVLAYIEKQSQAQGDTDFLKFVKNRDIPARLRLSFALCMAPLAMGLSDWFIHSLRDYSHAPVPKSKEREEEDRELRRALHDHTVVDENHWEWFLGDLKILDLDKSLSLTEALRLLWGPHSIHSRLIIYKLIALSRTASPIMRLTALETFEEGAAVAFELFRDAGREICEKENKPQLSYFGMPHKEQEDEHRGIDVKSIPTLISEYKWTAPEVEEAKKYVDEVCEYYTNLGKELLAYALKTKEHGGNELWPVASKRTG